VPREAAAEAGKRLASSCFFNIAQLLLSNCSADFHDCLADRLPVFTAVLPLLQATNFVAVSRGIITPHFTAMQFTGKRQILS